MIFTFVIENGSGETRRTVTAESGDSIPLAADEEIRLVGNESGEALISRMQQSGSDLIMFFHDGSQVVLSGFYPADSETGEDDETADSAESERSQTEADDTSLEGFGNLESDGGFSLIRNSPGSTSEGSQGSVDSSVNSSGSGSSGIGGGGSSGGSTPVGDPTTQNDPGFVGSGEDPSTNGSESSPVVPQGGGDGSVVSGEPAIEKDDETSEEDVTGAGPPEVSEQTPGANQAPVVQADAFSGQLDHHSGAYRFEEANPPSDPSGGELKHVTTVYDPVDGTLEFEMVVSDPAGSTADGFTLALNDGPNPTGLAGELALFYFDATGDEPVVSVYGYNGENVLTSFQDGSPEAGIQTPDRIASTLENDHPFSEVSAEFNSEDDKVFRFTVDAAEIKAHEPLHPGASEWTGAQFDDLLGIWLHPVAGLTSEYDETGFLTQWDIEGHGWFDTDDRPTALEGDALITNENTPAAFDLLANDSDPDGDPLEIAAINGQPAAPGDTVILDSGATVTINPDGTILYDPNGQYETLGFGDTAVDSFEYTASDGQGGTATTTASVTIRGVNDSPEPADDSGSTREDSTILIDLLANDTDVENDDLTVTQLNGQPVAPHTAVTLSSGAIVTLGEDGSANYDPNGQFDFLGSNEIATDTFTYLVEDGESGFNTATVTVTIHGANGVPVALCDHTGTNESETISVNLLSNDTDPENDDLTVTHINGQALQPGDSVTLDSGVEVTPREDGFIDYVPGDTFNSLNQGETAKDSFTYTISDGNGGTDTANVMVTINGKSEAPVNTAPDAVDDSGEIDEDTALSVNLLPNDRDPENDDLVITHIDGQALQPGDSVTLHSGVEVILREDGAVDYVPGEIFESLNQGETAKDSFEYTISDGNGGTDTATVKVTINGADDPTETTPDTATTDEETAVAVDVLANDSDPDASDNPLKVASIVTQPDKGSVTINPDGSDVTFDPAGDFEDLGAGEKATVTFEYETSTGAKETATITVTGVNDGPVAVNDSKATNEDAAVNIDLLGAADSAEADSDIDGDDLVVTRINELDAAGTITLASGALVSVNAGGTVDYDPNGIFGDLGAGENATDSFEYTIADGNGGTDTATVNVTINGKNDAPVIELNELVIAEGGTVVFDNTMILATDPDHGPEALTFTPSEVAGGQFELVADPENAITQFTQAQINNGAVQFVHDGSETAPSYTLEVVDPGLLTDSSAAAIDFGTSNDAPVAADDRAETHEGNSISVDLLANDTDAENDDLTVTHINGQALIPGEAITLASGAEVILREGGLVDYRPTTAFDSLNQGEIANDAFDYTIADDDGASGTATVNVTVRGLNSSPSIEANELEIREGEAVVLDRAMILATDPDHGPEDLVFTAKQVVAGQFELMANPGVSISQFTQEQIDNGAVQFVHDGSETGPSYFLEVVDPGGLSDTDAAVIDFSRVNDAPLAAADAATTSEDTVVSIDALQNDSDVDGASLAIVGVEGQSIASGETVSLASGANVILDAEGKLAYDPNGKFDTLAGGESAIDSFEYTISDGKGGNDSAAITVTISGVDPEGLPAAVDDLYEVEGSHTQTVNAVIIFDHSGSMNDDDLGGGLTRIDLARNAVLDFAARENVNSVKLVGFDSNVVDHYDPVTNPNPTTGDITGWVDVSSAEGVAFLETFMNNNFVAGGATDYSDAINAAMDNFGTPPPENDLTHFYFLSDGAPNPSSSSLSAQGIQGTWETFVADNADTAIAIGIGAGISGGTSNAALQEVAFANEDNPNLPDDLNNVIVISEADALADTLAATVTNRISGNLIDGDANGGMADDFGSDGPHANTQIVSIAFDGVTYSFDGAEISNDGNGSVIGGSRLDTGTALGGHLDFDFGTGDFTYEAPVVDGNSPQEVFAYVIQDGNGDTSAASVTVNVNGSAINPPASDPADLAFLLDDGDEGGPIEVNTEFGVKAIEPDFGGDPDQGAASGPVAGQGSSMLLAADEEAAAAAAAVAI